MARLTKTQIEDATFTAQEGRQCILWDDAVPGLGLRVYKSEKKSFVLSYRVKGRSHKFDRERSLSNDYRTESKDYADIADAYSKIESVFFQPGADGKPASLNEMNFEGFGGPADISLLVGYMKMIDPGSVVRELASGIDFGAEPAVLYAKRSRGDH